MTLSSIAHKLRALRAKAEDSGSPQPERDSAMAKYEELLRKYHLDASELEIREEGTGHIIVTLDTRGNSWAIGARLQRQIGKFTETRTWVNSRRSEFHILGLKSDADFAEWLLASLIRHVQAEAMEFILNLEAGYRGDVESFANAAAARINTRLREMVEQRAPTGGNGNALVVVRGQMIEQEMTRLGINLFARAPTAVSGREHAMAAGREAGDRASFARPLGGTGTTLRLGKV
jgi:hypothetical protein